MIAASWIYINILWLPAYVWDRIKNGENIRNCGWLLEKKPMSHVNKSLKERIIKCERSEPNNSFRLLSISPTGI